MDRDILLLLIGAGIALVSGAVGSLIQHLLSLRADRIKREMDKMESESRERRDRLLGRDSDAYVPIVRSMIDGAWEEGEEEEEEEE